MPALINDRTWLRFMSVHGLCYTRCWDLFLAQLDQTHLFSRLPRRPYHRHNWAYHNGSDPTAKINWGIALDCSFVCYRPIFTLCRARCQLFANISWQYIAPAGKNYFPTGELDLLFLVTLVQNIRIATAQNKWKHPSKYAVLQFKFFIFY